MTDPSICDAQDVAEALGADRRGRFDLVDLQAEESLRELESTARPRELALEEFYSDLAAARTVFIPDVHDDVRRHAAVLRTLKFLATSDGSLGRFECVGLEFMYSGWARLSANELRRAIGAHFTIPSDEPGKAPMIAAWTTDVVELARSAGWDVLALNQPKFNQFAAPTFAPSVSREHRNRSESGLTPVFALEPPGSDFDRRIRERDAWVAGLLRSSSRRTLVIYGRDHILSGRLTEQVPNSLILVPYDRELWRIACDRLDLSTRRASESLAIKLSHQIYLFHVGVSN